MDYSEISFSRKFGVEFELNSTDQRDFVQQPLNSGEFPQGIDLVADMVREVTKDRVIIKGWHHTHNNDSWIIKPDRSCGMEICSPPKNGRRFLEKLCKVAEAIGNESFVKINDKCSLHLTVDVSDCTDEQIAAIMVWWIKCEAVFLDSVPFHRKCNRYCQFIGLTDLFNTNTPLEPQLIIESLGSEKYYTINCFHKFKGNRETIEFRIAEKEGCTNPYFLKNWIRLIIHFVNQAKNRGMPNEYMPMDVWSSFLWLDPIDVMSFLGFLDSAVSNGMKQTRDWFVSRIYRHIEVDHEGIWSPSARSVALAQVKQLIECWNINPEEHFTASSNVIYGDDFAI